MTIVLFFFSKGVPSMISGGTPSSSSTIGSGLDSSSNLSCPAGQNSGVKLIFIWSEWGQIETVDHVRQLKYVQTFENNLSKINKPSITKTKIKPYTKVCFKPDYER